MCPIDVCWPRCFVGLNLASVNVTKRKVPRLKRFAHGTYFCTNALISALSDYLAPEQQLDVMSVTQSGFATVYVFFVSC